MAGFAGTALGDLFVFGDIRDAVREGSRYVSGEKLRRAGARAWPASASRSPPAPTRRSARRRRRGSGCRSSRRRARPGGSSARLARLDRPLAARRGRLVGARSAPARSLTEPAVAVRAAREAVKVEKAGRPGASRQRRRHGAGQGRHAGRARWAEARRRPARDVAGRHARREEGRQDPRDPQDARAAARSCCRSASFNLAVWMLGAIADAVRLRLRRPKRGVERMTLAPSRAARSERQARALCGHDGAVAGLNAAPFLVSICRACRSFITAPSRSPTSTRARASRSCWCTALPRPRR